MHGMACMHVGFYVLRKVGALGKVMVWLQRVYVCMLHRTWCRFRRRCWRCGWMDGMVACLEFLATQIIAMVG